MTDPETSAGNPGRMSARTGRWLLLVTALVQFASPTFVGFEPGSFRDPIVVPPDVFFAIWGVITTGCVAAAAWGLPARRAWRPPYRDIQIPVSVVQVLFVAWLVAAGTVPVLTLPIFLFMLLLLARSLRTVVTTPSDRITRTLLGGTLGLYTGWSTAAVWLNAATLLFDNGAGDTAVTAALALILLGAVASCAISVGVFRAQPGFVVAVGWALTGVLLSTASADASLLSATALIGLIVVGAATIRARRHRAHPAAVA